jgi:hypothetical protein
LMRLLESLEFLSQECYRRLSTSVFLQTSLIAYSADLLFFYKQRSPAQSSAVPRSLATLLQELSSCSKSQNAKR